MANGECRILHCPLTIRHSTFLLRPSSFPSFALLSLPRVLHPPHGSPLPEVEQDEEGHEDGDEELAGSHHEDDGEGDAADDADPGGDVEGRQLRQEEPEEVTDGVAAVEGSDGKDVEDA